MFVAEGVRYNYSVETTSKRVTSECLLAFPKGLPQTYFRRVFNAEKKEYRWRTGSQFEAPKDLRSKTRENSLFLSVGPQFNHPKLTPVYEWFRKSCHFLKLNEPESLSGEFTARMLKYGGDSRRTRVLNMLRRADLGVDDVVVKESKMSLDEIKEVLPPAEYRRLQNVEGDIVTAQPSLRHTGDGIDPVLFNFDAEESDGTKRLFALIGPWLDILEKGYTVFIDEIETSMHPVILKELLKLVFSDSHNPKGAQVIFTTHNTVLLSRNLMRRDQIWFTEKARSGDTRLYSLTDFSPRADERRDKRYLAGRYGGLPFIPEGVRP